MIMDTQTTFSGTIAADGTRAGQAVTATTISTNILDLRNNPGPALVDEGILGTDLYFVVVVPVTFNNLTSMTITLESDSTASLATAPVVHFSQTVLLAGLVSGATVVRVQIPSGDYKRYLGVRYTVAGTAPSTGTVYAFFTNAVQRNLNYPTSYALDV